MEKEEIEKIKSLIACVGEENATILEYWYDNSLFSNWTKPPKKFEPNNEEIAKDFVFYRDLGFQRLSSFACYLGEDYEELFGEADISAFATEV